MGGREGKGKVKGRGRREGKRERKREGRGGREGKGREGKGRERTPPHCFLDKSNPDLTATA